jgi:succinoglycan biosynthesis protein ExoA
MLKIRNRRHSRWVNIGAAAHSAFEVLAMDEVMQRKAGLAPPMANNNENKNVCISAGSVLVVIPCLNEAEHIEGLITKLLTDAGKIDMRIVVADGGSTDNTCNIVQQLMQRDNRVTLLDNKKRIAAAINDAVVKFGDDAEFLIRIDAHADYPPQFCAHLLKVQTHTQADSVVVSMLTAGHTCFQRAAAAAQNSVLGNGGSPHRNAPNGKWVDHGHHALMRAAAYRAVGGYDESFFWNEDAELDVRLRASGYRIYLAGAVSIVYHPRRSVKALFRQYFNYGQGRARNVLKHRQLPKLRQMVPLVVAPAICMLVLVPLSAIFAIPAIVWALACLGYGVFLGVRAGDGCAAGAGIAAMTMHAGWSFGFFKHLITDGLRNSPPARSNVS